MLIHPFGTIRISYSEIFSVRSWLIAYFRLIFVVKCFRSFIKKRLFRIAWHCLDILIFLFRKSTKVMPFFGLQFLSNF
jgi:hypothetical protein